MVYFFQFICYNPEFDSYGETESRKSLENRRFFDSLCYSRNVVRRQFFLCVADQGAHFFAGEDLVVGSEAECAVQVVCELGSGIGRKIAGIRDLQELYGAEAL